MYRADYRRDSRKAEAHIGSNLNTAVPSEIFLTDGKGAERPFVSRILSPGQTGVTDRGYQCHKRFDNLQDDGINFVCRIKGCTKLTVINENPVSPGGYLFRDTPALSGTPGVNQSGKPVRIIGYRIGNTNYLIATNRYDLTAGQIALICRLRWDIEKFFRWWEKHVKVYHLISRSRYGVTVQLLSGLIAFLLMAIYCRKQHNQAVSVSLPRQIRIAIRTDYPGYVGLYAIEAKESIRTVPEREEPVLWRILTTHEIKNPADAVQVIYHYSLRWQIGQLFRTLKSQGPAVEDSQMENGKGLKKLVITALSVALRIMQLVQDRDGKAGKPGPIVFTEKELIFLKVLSEQYEGKTDSQKNPFPENSLAWAAWIISRMATL